MRFNFPGFARFRPIAWHEWFENFDRHSLLFVFEEEVSDRAYALWQARGREHGNDQGDWFDAERELQPLDGQPIARYRFVTEQREAEI